LAMYDKCIETEDRDMVCHYEVTDEILDSLIDVYLERTLKAFDAHPKIVYLRSEVMDILRENFSED